MDHDFKITGSEQKLYRRAYWLSLFTIIFNAFEGVISVIFGYSDETLSLLGFGADSFIEVLSAIGIAGMILRIRQNPDNLKSRFEITALKINGTAFYVLAAGLLAGIIADLITSHQPESTMWGIIISSVSIIVMVWLVIVKKRTGRKLHSEPVIADANSNRICIYMSLVLLASSLIYELTGFPYSDVIGAAGLTYFSITEGRESFAIAKEKGSISENRQGHMPGHLTQSPGE